MHLHRGILDQLLRCEASQMQVIETLKLYENMALFQPCYFEAIVTVNLTTMLVLTSLFIGVSNSQPITAYPKMIDIWYEIN